MTNTGTVVIVDNGDQTRMVTWAGMNTASGTSQPFALGPSQSVTVTVQGTFGAGTWVLQGSNDGGVTYFPLKNWQNVAMSYTVASLDLMAQGVPLLIQWSWSGATAANVTAFLGLTKNYF